MGGGKKNYAAMQALSRRRNLSKSDSIEVRDVDKKAPPKKENVDELMNLWLNKDKKKEAISK